MNKTQHKYHNRYRRQTDDQRSVKPSWASIPKLQDSQNQEIYLDMDVYLIISTPFTTNCMYYNDNGYVLIVVIVIRYFPNSWLTSGLQIHPYLNIFLGFGYPEALVCLLRMVLQSVGHQSDAYIDYDIVILLHTLPEDLN
jgi:hypothetical protein